jgi:hypothetical protein
MRNFQHFLVLLAILPITVTHEWVKGHYTGKKKELKHFLNYEADQLAGTFQRDQHPHKTLKKLLALKIASILIHANHNKAIEDRILRKTNWSCHVFDMIDWDGHECAFKRLPRFQRQATAKLIHQLVNANRQNHLYYGTPNTCPICEQEEETVRHAFTCSHKTAKDCQEAALKTLKDALRNANSPPAVIDALCHGIREWTRQPDVPHIRALTAGSLRGPCAV